jgi:hypothetical protein
MLALIRSNPQIPALDNLERGISTLYLRPEAKKRIFFGGTVR